MAGCGGSHTTSGSTGLLAKLDVKLPAPAGLRAATPQFAFKDSLGRAVRLSQFRGGSAASKLQIIAVSVAPKGDTPATVKSFLAAHEMTGRMEYLVGTFKELSPVWRAYGVEVQASPEKRERSVVGHSAFVYGLSGRGSVVVLYPPSFDPAWIVHDVPLLAGA